MKRIGKYFMIPVILFLTNPLYSELGSHPNRLNLTIRQTAADDSLKPFFRQKYPFLAKESVLPVLSTPVYSTRLWSCGHQNQNGSKEEKLRQQLAHFEKLKAGASKRALVFWIASLTSAGLYVLAYTGSRGEDEFYVNTFYVVSMIGIPVFTALALISSIKCTIYKNKVKFLQRELKMSMAPTLSPTHLAIGLQIEF